MYNQFVILLRFTFCNVKWQHFKGVVENVTLSCSKFSQLSNSETLKIFQQLTKLRSAMHCLHFWTTLYKKRVGMAVGLVRRWTLMTVVAMSGINFCYVCL